MDRTRTRRVAGSPCASSPATGRTWSACSRQAWAERIEADLHDPDAATRAAEGSDLIFHCVGLPYPQFADHPVLARATAEAMRRTGARCLLVSSYYAYEPILRTPIDENHPREPRAFKARMRKEQEDILLDAGAAVTLLPDFYGPGVEISMLGLALRDLARGRTANWIGRPDVLRQHIYVPDAAQILVDLAGREEAYGQRWNVATTATESALPIFSGSSSDASGDALGSEPWAS